MELEEQLKSHLTTKLPVFEWLKLEVWGKFNWIVNLEDIPKVPLDFIPLAKDSIQRYWDAHYSDKSELIYEKLAMPMKNEDEQYLYNGNTYITAVEAVEWLRLDAWLEEDDN